MTSRSLIANCFLAGTLLAGTTGCGPHTAAHTTFVVLNDPAVRKIIAEVGIEVGSRVVIWIGESIIDALVSPARADSGTTSRPDPAPEEKREISAVRVGTAAAQVASYRQGVERDDSGNLSFACQVAEREDVCSTRLRQQIQPAAYSRAEVVAKTFTACRDQVGQFGSSGVDVVKSTQILNSCMSAQGVGEEVALLTAQQPT